MRATVAAGLGAALSILSGCVAYVPPLVHQFNRGDLEQLRVGETTRTEAEATLRSADWLRRESSIEVAEESRNAGHFAAALGVGGGVGTLTTQRYRILTAFDERNVLTRFELEERSPEANPVPGRETHAFDAPPPDSALVAHSGLPWIQGFHGLACGASAIAAVNVRQQVWLWRHGPGEPPIELAVPHAGLIRGLAFESGDDRLLCLSNEVACIDLARIAASRSKSIAKAPPAWIRKHAPGWLACVSPDGSRLVAAGPKKGVVVVLDAASGRELASWQATRGTIVDLAWSGDGRRVAVADADFASFVVGVWDLGAGSPALEGGSQIARGRFTYAPAIRFSPDGRRLAVNCGTHVEIWNLGPLDSGAGGGSAPGAPHLADAFLLPFGPEPGPIDYGVTSLAFSADGNRLAATNTQGVVYDLARSRRVWTHRWQAGQGAGYLNKIDFLPGTDRLVASSNRGVFSWSVSPTP